MKKSGVRVGTVKMSEVAAHPTMRMDAEYWLDRADEKGDDDDDDA